MTTRRMFQLNRLARALAFIWQKPYHEMKALLMETDEGTRTQLARTRRVRAVMASMTEQDI